MPQFIIERDGTYYATDTVYEYNRELARNDAQELGCATIEQAFREARDQDRPAEAVLLHRRLDLASIQSTNPPRPPRPWFLRWFR